MEYFERVTHNKSDDIWKDPEVYALVDYIGTNLFLCNMRKFYRCDKDKNKSNLT